MKQKKKIQLFLKFVKMTLKCTIYDDRTVYKNLSFFCFFNGIFILYSSFIYYYFEIICNMKNSLLK